MTEKQMSVRLVATGAQQVKAELMDVGNTGQRAFGQMERSSRATGYAMQNASYQLGDFFVQVESGTPIMRAAAQQLPQMLGSFGMWGAVAGAAIPIGVLLWQTIQRIGDESGQSAVEVKALAAAVEAVEKASSASQSKIDQLRFGVDEDYQVDLLREQIRLRDQYNIKVGQLNGYLATTTDSVDRQRVTTAELRREIENVAAAYNTNVELLREQEDRAVQLAILEGIKTQRANEEAAARAASADEAARQERAMVQAYEVYASTRVEADLLAAAAEAAGVSAADLSHIDFGNLAAASSYALQLAANLGISLDVATRLAALGPQGINTNPDPSGQVYSGRGGDPRQQGGSFLDWQTREATAWLAAWKPPTKGGGKGGSGGGVDKTRQDALREAERLFDQTRTKAEQFAEEEARINQLFKDGYIDADLHARGLDMLGERYLGLTSAAAAFEDIQADLKEAILDFAGGAEGAFDQVTKSIERMVFQAVLFGEGPFGEWFGGGALGWLTKGLGLPSFDGGGWTGDGARTGGLDGKGGYLAMLHPREHVIDMTRQQAGAANTNRGPRTTVQVINMGGQAVEEERSTGPDGDEMVRVIVGRQLSRGDHDKALSARTGGKPRMVRR